MRIMIASDAWHPQINGVVRVFETTRQHLAAEGHAVMVTGPDRFPSLGAPGYPEVRLALFPGRRLRAFAHTHLSACARPRRGLAWRATGGGFGARTGAAFRCISSRFARSVASTVAILSSAPSGTSMMPASQRFASSS